MKFQTWFMLAVLFLVCLVQTVAPTAERSGNGTKQDRTVDNLVLKNEKIAANKIYCAQTSITANGMIDNAPRGQVTFVAGKTIRLLPGFRVERGNRFRAYIDAAPDSETQSRKATFETDYLNAIDSAQNTEMLIPTEYSLAQNYPNPFNPQTEIAFALPRAGHVTLRIFNALGQEICTLVDRPYEAGYHSVVWNGKDNRDNPVASGVYFYQLQAGDFVQVHKMSLLQ